jgi:NADPH-dependent 2,4-dienoyl-CoA reductase/sulfur reductase-like enzyme/nitrite reductase/ring-hydroxylating ferredoxin subunit
MSTEAAPSGPDLALGIAVDRVPDGGLLGGHVGGEPVLLARRGEEIFAVGAVCTHYGAPLSDGLLIGETIRCPWHHASFCLRTGAVQRAPALDALPSWRVERSGGIVHVRERIEPELRPAIAAAPGVPARIVIIGGGAAGNAAAETLRNEGYEGKLTLLSADETLPCDRPNLSKGFLAGAADDASNLLRSPEYYEQRHIDIRLGSRVAAIDAARRQVVLEQGSRLDYDTLLLATGAEPVKLDVPGANRSHVHYLRTLTDSRVLAAHSLKARRAVVIGASFIGLEVAASLRARGLAVDVVAPDRVPMEGPLGAQVGAFIRRLHEDHGVTFHLETSVISIGEELVTLASRETLQADLVVVGIGVRPALALAEQAGLTIDRGVVVDAHLETSIPGVFAAGDIARWPDLLSGENIRVEHWVVAERQGQTAARNMLGRRERFDCVPFFWTEQYDFSLGYVGHGRGSDRIEVEGDLEARDCSIRYFRDGEARAVAVVHRDHAGLRSEVEFERIMKLRLKNEVARREILDLDHGVRETSDHFS